MKTAMQELSEWLETPNVWGENNFSVRSKVKQLLEEEKAQITNAFVNGMMQGCTLQLREEFEMVQTPEQFFNEKYKDNEKMDT